jgi:uncharacterized protein (DUF2062 family)
MYKFTKEKAKKFIKKFFLINDTPHKIAAGAALGVFLGIAPGEGVLCTLLLSSLLGFNRLAAMAGVLAVNMWTTFLILPFAATIGSFVFGKDYADLSSHFYGASGDYVKLFFSKIFFFNIALPLLVGFFITAGTIALTLYFLLLLLLNFKGYQKKAHLLHKENLGD